MSEWLRRKIRNLLGLARAGSNPVTVEFYSFCSPHKQTIAPCMFAPSHIIPYNTPIYTMVLVDSLRTEHLHRRDGCPKIFERELRDGESNPGLPRDRRGY
jgi:hypothetical protein